MMRMREEYEVEQVPDEQGKNDSGPSLRAVYRHWRVAADGFLHHYQRSVSLWEPEPKGGLTHCSIYNGDEVISTGWALCSEMDNFCYRVGRAIARGRAMHNLTFNDRGELIEAKCSPSVIPMGSVSMVRNSLPEVRK